MSPLSCTKITEEHGFDEVMGQPYEVWFIKGTFLYEVSTYKELEKAIYINP